MRDPGWKITDSPHTTTSPGPVRSLSATSRSPTRRSPAAEFPLVLLHGLTGHRDDFLPLLPLLRERHPDLWLLAPDLRGHGDSTHSGDPSTCTLRATRRRSPHVSRPTRHRAVSPARPLLRRHGLAALRADAHRERLDSLILLGTAPFAPDGFSAETFEKSGEIARARGMAFLQARIEETSRSAVPTRPSDRAVLRWSDSYWPHHRHRFRSLDPVAYRELGLAHGPPGIDRASARRARAARSA